MGKDGKARALRCKLHADVLRETWVPHCGECSRSAVCGLPAFRNNLPIISLKYQTTRRHLPQDGAFRSHRCESFKHRNIEFSSLCAACLGKEPRQAEAEAWLWYQASPCWICGRRSGAGTGFLSQYFSLTLSVSFHQCSVLIHPSPTLYKCSNWQRRLWRHMISALLSSCAHGRRVQCFAQARSIRARNAPSLTRHPAYLVLSGATAQRRSVDVACLMRFRRITAASPNVTKCWCTAEASDLETGGLTLGQCTDILTGRASWLCAVRVGIDRGDT